MNLENNLERNYRSKRINEMKVELRNERKRAFNIMIDLLKEQRKIINEIKKEKQVLRENQEYLRQVSEAKKIQKKNTLEFFKKVLNKLNERVAGNVNLQASYMINSHGRDGKVIDPFKQNYINIDLLNSLCFENNILLTILVNEVSGEATMKFTVNPRHRLTPEQYNSLRESNNNNINYFHQSLAVSHTVYKRDEVNSNPQPRRRRTK